ncbi:MAG: ABC transporter permease [Ancalomicrobiaceae bacterium]|nr:ABC transporter permease [Ancalomicrobiaceae bacterium]
MIRTARLPNRELIIVFVVTIAVFCWLSGSFRTTGNLENVLIGFSHTAILAVGQSLPLLLGGIDLSVGSIMALAGMAAFDAYIVLGLPGWIVLPGALVLATLAGAVNGVLIAKLKLQPFIATLATMAAYRGLTYAISGRQIWPEIATRPITDPLIVAFDDYVGHVPYAFFLLLIVFAVVQLLLGVTKFGRDLYTIGGNVEAARLCGINVDRAVIISYSISGLCAGFAALVLVSRMTTSTESLGIGIEMSAIAAAIIGGVSLQGGIGNVFGPVIGAFLLGVVLIGLNLVGIPTYAQPVLTGLILLGAVWYDRLLVQRRARAILAKQAANP